MEPGDFEWAVEVVEEAFRKSMVRGAVIYVTWGVVIVIVITILTAFYYSSDLGRSPLDDRILRSGLKLHIDKETGCHYISDGNGGLLRRTRSDKTQICEE